MRTPTCTSCPNGGDAQSEAAGPPPEDPTRLPVHPAGQFTTACLIAAARTPDSCSCPGPLHSRRLASASIRSVVIDRFSRPLAASVLNSRNEIG